MFQAIGWLVSFPLLLVTVFLASWATLDATFHDDYLPVVWLLMPACLGGAFLALAVGYMLRDA